jgi:hypothetical protein
MVRSSRDNVVSRAHLKRTPRVKGSKPSDAEEPSLTTLMESQLITMHTMNEFFQRHLMGILRDMVFTMDRMDARLKDLVQTTKVLGNVLADGRQNDTAPRAGVAVAASVLAKEMDASKLIPKRQSPVVYARDTSSSGPVIRTPARTVDTRSTVAEPEGKVWRYRLHSPSQLLVLSLTRVRTMSAVPIIRMNRLSNLLALLSYMFNVRDNQLCYNNARIVIVLR